MADPTPFKRSTLQLGPGTIVIGDIAVADPAPVKLYDSTGIELTPDRATKDLPSSLVGKAGIIFTDRIFRIAATPVGEVSQALVNILYPWRNLTGKIGGMIHDPDKDVPLYIHSTSGKLTTFGNSILTRPPELVLSTVETSFGQAEFSCLTPGDKTSKDPMLGIVAKPYDLGVHGTPLSGAVYTAKFGGLVIDSTVNGFRVNVEPEITPLEVDESGVLTWILRGLRVTARCTPTQLDEKAILDALGINRGRGMSAAGTDPLVITGTGLIKTVTLERAALTQGPLKWGSGELRAGELLFEANAKTDGSLFNIVVEDPPTDK